MLDKSKRIYFVLPIVLFLCVFYLYGILVGSGESFGIGGLDRESITLSHYKGLIGDKVFRDSFIFTFKTSIISSILALLTSTFIIFIYYLGRINNLFKGKVYKKIVEMPLYVPYLIAGYIFYLFLTQRGVLGEFFVRLGVIDSYDSFPILTNDERSIGIVLTYIWKCSPFIVMMSLPIIERVQNQWIELKKMYNIGDIKFFKEVVLPLIAPTLTISFFIILAYIFTSFEVPYILGRTHPKALSVLAFDMYTVGGLDKRREVMAINVIISSISLILGGLTYLYSKKFNSQGRW